MHKQGRSLSWVPLSAPEFVVQSGRRKKMCRNRISSAQQNYTFIEGDQIYAATKRSAVNVKQSCRKRRCFFPLIGWKIERTKPASYYQPNMQKHTPTQESAWNEELVCSFIGLACYEKHHRLVSTDRVLLDVIGTPHFRGNRVRARELSNHARKKKKTRRVHHGTRRIY